LSKEVVPNFIDVAEVEPNYENRDYILYLGRMLIKKGVMTLIRAMKANRNRNLKIAGVGPDLDAAKALAARERLDNIEFTGFLSGNELQEAISGALAIVVPSELYENCPMSILEAFAHGKPVIGSHIGGIPEQITHGENGYLFPPADSVRLGELIDSMFGNRDLARKMGMEARKMVETKYSAERHYALLLEIYNRLLAERA
jgi:glycosyltransferase involved in cell wall biosynthesis